MPPSCGCAADRVWLDTEVVAGPQDLFHCADTPEDKDPDG